MQIVDLIRKIGIVPVVKLDDAKDAQPLGKALIDGGLPCAEVTFRTAAAKESIQIMVENFPDMLVGAGTVLTLQQLDDAISAGAKFIVSPGFNREIVEACIKRGIPVFPGCSSPTDIEAALSLGLSTVKFFPAEQSGGIAAIKAMAAPYGELNFMPTGGVNSKNINDYLSFNKVVACGGSWMVDPALVAAGDFAEITRRTKEAISTILGYSLMHVGINCEDREQMEHVCKTFCSLFNLEYKPGNSTVFAGSLIETMMPAPNKGKNGHIAIGTNSMERAMYQLERLGVKFIEDTRYNDEKGLKAIYTDLDFCGFAVHLLRK